MRCRSQVARRSAEQVRADRTALTVAQALGAALKDARTVAGRSQRAIAAIAGMAHSTVVKAEHGNGEGFTLRTWARLAVGSGVELHAYLRGASAADRPRDAVHLKVQELLLRTAAPGGWHGVAELRIDDATRGSRFIDVALERRRERPEVAVLEVIDWTDDVGAALRDWTRRLARVDQVTTARLARDDVATGRLVLPAVSGCWVLRATHRNRALVRDHRLVFRSRFPGSGTAWLMALQGEVPMPSAPAILWVSLDGERIWSARL